jgi:HEXXH motif-containing protein
VNTILNSSYRKEATGRHSRDRAGMITNARLEDGLYELANAIKILVYEECPHYFELLDINDDSIFLDPLLFAYFNHPDIAHRPPLEQLLAGYIPGEKRPLQVPIRADGNNLALLPNIGYFRLMEPPGNDGNGLFLHRSGPGYIIKQGERVIPHEFHPLTFVEGLEVSTYASPFVLPYFALAWPQAEKEFYSIDFTDIARTHLHHIERGLKLIQRYHAAYYRQLKMTNRRIMLYDYFPVNSFATKTFHGCIFMCARPASSIAFFLDDLVHQCSHNLLNSFITDTSVYFKVDPEQRLLKEFIPNEQEERTVYSAFHGLFTVSQRAIFFSKIYDIPDLFTDSERHELLARYCDQFRRYKSGLEKADPDVLYTAKGKKLYDQIDQCCAEALGKISRMIAAADFSNQVSRFDYNKFCELNPIQQFREMHFM